jgi:hypothetical protein
LLLLKRKSNDKLPKAPKTEVVNLSLETEIRCDPKVAKQPSTTVNYEARISQKNKSANDRGDSTSKNKSVRRNRQERLQSAHSAQRQKVAEKSQTKQTKKKFSAIKNATNRVMPKV